MNRRRRLTHRLLRRIADHLRQVAPTDWPISVRLVRQPAFVSGAHRIRRTVVRGPRGGLRFPYGHKIEVCSHVSAQEVVHILIHEWAHALVVETNWERLIRDRRVLTPMQQELEDHNDEFWRVNGELYRAMLRFDHGAAA